MLSKELEIVEQVLIEKFTEEDWVDGDQDIIWDIVVELRKKLDNPDFASSITDPNEGLGTILDEDGDEDGEGGGIDFSDD